MINMSLDDAKKLVEFLSALLLPVTAVLALWTTWRQCRAERDRDRLEWFDKRYSVFKGAIAFVYHAIEKGSIALPELWRFDAATADAVFLFDEDIPAYLAGLRGRAVRLYALTERTGDPAKLPADRLEAVSAEIEELCNWFGEQPTNLPRQFQRYLGQGKAAARRPI